MTRLVQDEVKKLEGQVFLDLRDPPLREGPKKVEDLRCTGHPERIKVSVINV